MTNRKCRDKQIDRSNLQFVADFLLKALPIYLYTNSFFFLNQMNEKIFPATISFRPFVPPRNKSPNQ